MAAPENHNPSAATEMVPPIKYTNRRRMAWMSAVQTLAFIVVFFGFAFAYPAAVPVLVPVFPIALAFLNWPQMAYFGVTHLIDRFVARGQDLSRVSE